VLCAPPSHTTSCICNVSNCVMYTSLFVHIFYICWSAGWYPLEAVSCSSIHLRQTPLRHAVPVPYSSTGNTFDAADHFNQTLHHVPMTPNLLQACNSCCSTSFSSAHRSKVRTPRFDVHHARGSCHVPGQRFTRGSASSCRIFRPSD
jgi:hypothetical protein